MIFEARFRIQDSRFKIQDSRLKNRDKRNIVGHEYTNGF